MPKIPRRQAILRQEEGIALIPLGANAKYGYAIVDIEDSWVDEYWWHVDSHGYPVTNPRPYARGMRMLYLHTLFIKPKSGFVADHIDRDAKNNRRSNLRRVTHAQNMQNKAAHRTSKWGSRTSRYKGVSYDKKCKSTPWVYALYNKEFPTGKIYGYTATEEEAALQYNRLAKKYHGASAVLNVVI